MTGSTTYDPYLTASEMVFNVKAPTNNLSIDDDTVVFIGDEETITGKELKICIRYLKQLTMQGMPEEFI